ncbi:MAG: hypothetical protein HC900_00135 [Methylacidiphilales bacterium]|nr:hypothetical protein [Candidatus Methylacidiphilales bacterium]
MTSFASVALISRGGKTVFRPPRREIVTNATQARKSASRHWSTTSAQPGDRLLRVFVVSVEGRAVVVAERTPGTRGWKAQHVVLREALHWPHIAAALDELGFDASAGADVPPHALVINGWTYRRDPAPAEF